MSDTKRGRGYAYFLGIDPISLLGKGAQYIVDSGRCRVTMKDARAIVDMSKQRREKLSAYVVAHPGKSMTDCIHATSPDIPSSTVAARNMKERMHADDAATAVEKYFDGMPLVAIDEFCKPHGTIKSDERMELLQCLDEAKKAWWRLRDLSRGASGIAKH